MAFLNSRVLSQKQGDISNQKSLSKWHFEKSATEFHCVGLMQIATHSVQEPTYRRDTEHPLTTVHC